MRLFICIELPEQIKQELVRIQQELKKLNLFSGTYVAPDNLHVTMLFLGHLDQEAYPPLLEQLKKVTASPFNLTLGTLAVPNWSDPKVLWVDTPSEELTTLYNNICTQLTISEKRPFSGHCTLARIKKVSDKNELKKALATLQVKPLSWHATTFTLMDSQTHPTGPEYTSLHRFRLE